MKLSQLSLAVGALMAMVFAITYAMNFLGSDKPVDGPPPPPPPPNMAELVFETASFPPVKNTAKEWEVNHPGHADFWFTNPNSKELRVALESKSCKCTDVSLFLSNPEWDARRERNRHVAEAAGMVGPAVTIYTRGQGDDMSHQESTLTRYSLNERHDEGFAVPAGARGWVRLAWTAEKRGGDSDNGQMLTAKLWMNHKNSGMVQPFEVKIVVLPIVRLLDVKETAAELSPAHYPRLASLGNLSPRDLPRHVNLVFGSATRAQVAIKAEAIKHKFQEEADLFVVGKPVALGRAETEKIRDEVKDGPLVSTYRVPVTLMDKVGSRLFDTGPFRRIVRVTVNDGEMDPIEIPVVGFLQGDVEVGTQEDRSRISFGPFNRASAPESHIQLATEVDGLELELDKARIPEYLDASLKKNKQIAGLSRRTWQLTVTVKPLRASGVFPRDDDAAYHDSAIYVKSSGAGNRLIRIPVEGNAVNQ